MDEHLQASESPKRKKTSPPPRRGRARTNVRAYPFNFKLHAVKLYFDEGYSVDEITQALGLGNGTFYGWLARYRKEGEEGLKPRKPTGARKKPPSPVKKQIVAIKKENPGFGVKRISQILRRWFTLPASPETVRKTLHESELMDKPKKKPKRNPQKPRFFERATPNQMWQTDIFTFRLGGRNAYLIAFMDDHSRYLVGLGLYRSQTAEHVIETYRTAITEYGVPKEMLTDNGRQYTNWRGTSRFEAELKKESVRHIKSRPQHPMTLGKVERFWRTIWDEYLGRAQFDSFESAQARLALWVKHYNHRRPHSSLDGMCPADRFFGVESELRLLIEKSIQQNILELALRGEPQKPFYMVGRMDGQSVVMRAEKGKLVMQINDDKEQPRQELIYDLKKGDFSHVSELVESTRQEEIPPAPDAPVDRPPESGSGIGVVDRTSETFRALPGVGDPVDDPRQLAEPRTGSDAPCARAETAQGRREAAGAYDPPPTAPREEDPETQSERPFVTPGETPRHHRVEAPFHPLNETDDETVRERNPIVQAETASEASAEGACPSETGSHLQGPQRADDSRPGCREPRCLPQNLLRMGEPGPQLHAPFIGGWETGPSAEPCRPGEGIPPEESQRTGEGTHPGQPQAGRPGTPTGSPRSESDERDDPRDIPDTF